MRKVMFALAVVAASASLVHNAYAGETEVVCLTPDGSKALCKPNGVLVWQSQDAPHKTVILFGAGGSLPAYLDRFRELAESGNDVEVRGPCRSACTMIVAYIPAH